MEYFKRFENDETENWKITANSDGSVFLIDTKRNISWMSSQRIELDTHWQLFDEDLKGNVLIAGLGLGYDAYEVALRDKVDMVDVIEMEGEVIRLLEKKLSLKKITVFHDSILEYLKNTSTYYDYIWIDIFPEGSHKYQEEIAILNRAAQRVLKPYGRFLTWRNILKPTL